MAASSSCTPHIYHPLVIALDAIILGAITSYLCGQPDAARIRERSYTGDDGYKRSEDMTVHRTQVGYQTRYTLRAGATLSCVLTFGAGDSTPAEWTILLESTGTTRDRHVIHRFAAPVAVRLRAWLAQIIGAERAAELAAAVGARPPRPAAWQRDTSAAALSIPRQRDRRA